MFIIIFIVHFAILNYFFENCFNFCIIIRNSFHFCLRIILFFLSYILTYFVQSMTIRQFRRMCRVFFTIFVYFNIYYALIILWDLTYNVKTSIVYFNVLNNCLVYSSIRWRLVIWFDNDFDICFFNMLMNFFSFVVFQFFKIVALISFILSNRLLFVSINNSRSFLFYYRFRIEVVDSLYYRI